MKALEKRPLVFDGAYDHNLAQFFPIVRNPAFRDLPSLSCPVLVKQMHHDYAQAGAEVLQTFSWGCHPDTYDGLMDVQRLLKAARQAAEIAKEVAATYSANGHRRWVAGIIPAGVRLLFLGQTTGEEVQAAAFNISKALIEGGADMLVIALQNSLLDAKAAYAGVERARVETKTKLPVLLAFDLNPGGLISGENLERVFADCKSMDLFSLGVYLTTHLEKLPEPVFQSTRRGQRTHVFSDAGYTDMKEGIVTHSLDAKAYGRAVAEQAKRLGLSFVGGGWGVSPSHIGELRRALEDTVSGK
jgi:5-methyltetrahydrofolate--homocysteine methyltransferase